MKAMAVLVPNVVREQLSLPQKPILAKTIGLYRLMNSLGLRSVVQRVLLPTEYLEQIRALDKGRNG